MGKEYNADRPVTLGPLDSEEIRQNFQILERFNNLRAVPVENDNPAVRINGGTIVVGDQLVDVSEQVIEYDGSAYSLPDPSLCSKRTDLIVVNRLGEAQVIPGEPGGEAPALPKGVYSVALLYLEPGIDEITDQDVTDTRMFNVAGTDTWWESGPTFQRESKPFDNSSDVMDLPDGISYDPGTGNLMVIVGGDLRYPETHYTEQNPTQIEWIDGEQPPDDETVVFVRMSGDGTTRYFSDRDDFTYQGDNPAKLNFFYTVESGSLHVYHKGELLTEGVHYEEVGDDGDSSRHVEFKQNFNVQIGDQLNFLKQATFPDHLHGYHHVPGEDPVPQVSKDHISSGPSDVDVWYEAQTDGGNSTLEMMLDRNNNDFKIRSYSRLDFTRVVSGQLIFHGVGVNGMDEVNLSAEDEASRSGNVVNFTFSTGTGDDGVDVHLDGSPRDAHVEVRITDLKNELEIPDSEPTIDMVTYGNSVVRRNLFADEPADENAVFRMSLIPNFEENFARTDQDERFNGDVDIDGTLDTSGWITEGASL